MISNTYKMHIKKEALKFSSAHMTVFPDNTKESLHGHNYTTDVTLTIGDASLTGLISFTYFKQLLEKMCAEWDSRVLIARNCPFLKMHTEANNEIEFRLCGKRYVFPIEDVVFLPVENISVECLTELFCKKLSDQLSTDLVGKVVTGIEVRIEETPGQGATIGWAMSQQCNEKDL